MQKHPEEIVNEIKEVVTNSEVTEPTEEEAIDTKPEPKYVSEKGRKKKQ